MSKQATSITLRCAVLAQKLRKTLHSLDEPQMLQTKIHCLLLAIPAFLLSCVSPSRESNPATEAATRAEVVNAMQRYMVAARAVNPDEIAAFYTPTAVLFEPGINPIEGRETIRAFIASFPGVKVDSATATPDTIEVFGGTAFFWGSYFERLSFPGQPVSEQYGKFVTEWVRQADGQWLIQRFFRIPVQTLTMPDRAK